MSRFEEKVYELVTQPDNWRVAKEVNDRMWYVKDRLFKDFWNELKQSLESRLDLNEWQVRMAIENAYEENKYNNDSGFCITHPSWKGLFHIGFGNLRYGYIGVWCDSDSNKITNALYEQFANELTNKYIKLTKDEKWFPGWYGVDNFEDWSTLDQILPSNRKAFIDKYTDMLLDLKDKAKPIIDEAMRQIAARA